MTTSERLADVKRARQLVRFHRRFENSPICGYVLDVGPKFFLLSLVSDRIHFDGFEIFRFRDVHALRPDPYTAFVELALKRRRERRPKKPAIKLESIGAALESAGRCFALVTIHREEADPDVCHIGRIVGIGRGRVSLLEIDAHAMWDKQPTEYKLSEITRVNFGGQYEDALYLVGAER